VRYRSWRSPDDGPDEGDLPPLRTPVSIDPVRDIGPDQWIRPRPYGWIVAGLACLDLGVLGLTLAALSLLWECP